MLIISAFLLDVVFGDPEAFFHPVRAMGRWISFVYKKVLAAPQKRQRALGWMAALASVSGLFLALRLLLALLPDPLRMLLSLYLCYTALAAKNLAEEARGVRKALGNSLAAARRQLSRIVGRQTETLSREEIICAVVETVSENTSDGVIAPLFYAMLLGPAGAMAYKMANTLDSMVGYDNDKYREAGRGAAKLDDLLNWIPARLTAALMVLCAGSPTAMRRAARTVFRYRRCHLSPNAGYPESAAAGVLGIRLGGGHTYFGRYVHKPYIGDGDRAPRAEDIDAAVGLLWRTSVLFLIAGTVLLWIRSGI